MQRGFTIIHKNGFGTDLKKKLSGFDKTVVSTFFKPVSKSFLFIWEELFGSFHAGAGNNVKILLFSCQKGVGVLWLNQVNFTSQFGVYYQSLLMTWKPCF